MPVFDRMVCSHDDKQTLLVASSCVIYLIACVRHNRFPWLSCSCIRQTDSISFCFTNKIQDVSFCTDSTWNINAMFLSICTQFFCSHVIQFMALDNITSFPYFSSHCRISSLIRVSPFLEVSAYKHHKSRT